MTCIHSFLGLNVTPFRVTPLMTPPAVNTQSWGLFEGSLALSKWVNNARVMGFKL